MGADPTSSAALGRPSHPVLGALLDALWIVLAAMLVATVTATVLGPAGASLWTMLAGLALQQVLVVGLGTAALVWRAGQGWSGVLGHRPYLTARWLGIALLLAPGLALLQTPPLTLWSALTHTTPPVWYGLLDLHGPWRFMAVAVSVALIPPVCEELFFRGYLQWRFGALGPRGAIALQALLFAGWHGDLFGLPVYLVIGATLGALRHHARSLLPGIGAHVIINALGLYDVTHPVALYTELGPWGAPLGIGLVLSSLALHHRTRPRRSR